MKGKNEEKRYLYDVLNEIKFGFKMKVLIFLLIVIGTIVFAPINFHYNPIINYDWKESWKENNDNYNYLHEIANNVIQERESINIKNIPEDIRYSIDYQNDDIVFYYYINEYKSYYNMRITLSKKLEIIDKECSIELETEEQCQSRYNSMRKIMSYLFGFVCIQIIGLIIVLFESILMGILFIHKKLDEKRED